MKNSLDKWACLCSISMIFAASALNAEPVARIVGGSDYETLPAAFSAASSGDVVELLSDVELTSAFTASGNKTVTLRGGAYTLSSTVAIKNTTYINTSAGENFRITDGFKLVIDGGKFTNLTFSAVSTGSTAATTSTVTVNGGVFQGCELFAINYSSKVTVNGGDFKGGTILSRSYTASDFTTVEINGGVFNDLLCCVRPYDARPDVFNIYSGVFTNCEMRAMNGTTSALTIGDPEDSSTLRFVDCKIYSQVAYKTAKPKVYITRGYFENCAIEPHNTSASGANYGTATLQVSGGDFEGCKFSALVRDASSLGGEMTATLKITGGSFSNGYIRGDTGDGKSYTASPKIEIQGGEFDTIPIAVFAGISTAKGYLTVSGGTFNYCLLATWGRVNQGTISGGTFNGCKIGAFAHQRYSGCDEKMTISNMTGNGCLFFAKVTGGSGSNTGAKATTAINGGSFIGCTSMKETDSTYKNAYVNVASGVSLNGTVANVGANGYSSLSAAFATLQNADTADIDLAANSYSPISSTHQTSPVRKWSDPVLSTDVIEVASGKSAQVSADGYVVDANFSVSGTLLLDGGYYTGEITPLQGGTIQATVGTKFKNEPVGVLPVGSAAIQVDENGDYVVEELSSLSVIVATDAAQQYGAGVISYGVDDNVTSGTAKTYTAPAEEILTEAETTKAVCTGWSLYAANAATGENDLVRESSSGALEGESATTCIVTPEASVLTLVWHWKIQHYVALASEDPAKGSVSGGGWHDEGAEISASATPATYYAFSRWTGDTDVLESATVTPATFTLSGPVSLTAEFRPAIECTFKYDGKAVGQGDAAVSQVTSEVLVDSVNSVVECAAAEYVLLGGTVNHRALCLGWDLYEVVNGEDVFVRASTNTAVVGENTTNALVTITGDMKLVWNWEEQYLITAGADAGGGSVTGGGWSKAGAGFRLTAVPAEGYKFLCWAQSVDTSIGICSASITYGSLTSARTSPFVAVFVPEEYDTPAWLYLPEYQKLVQLDSPHWVFAEVTASGSNISIPKSTAHVAPESASDLDFTGTMADVEGNEYFLREFKNASSGTITDYNYNLFGQTGSARAGKVGKLILPESFTICGSNILQQFNGCKYFEFKGNLANGFNSRFCYNATSCQRIRLHHFPPNVPNESDNTFVSCGADDYKFRMEYPDFLESAWLSMANNAKSSGARYDYKDVMSDSEKSSAFAKYKAVFGSSAAEPKGYAALNYRNYTPKRYCALVPYTPAVKPGKVALGMMGLPYGIARAESMSPSYGYHEYATGEDIVVTAPQQFTTFTNAPYLCKGYVLSSNPAVTNRYVSSFTISGAEAANIGLTWIWKQYNGFKGLIISVK